MTTSVLVTGGAGYIGSHTALELLRAGYRVVVADDLSNSSAESITAVRRLAGVHEELEFVEIDLVDEGATDRLVEKSGIEAVIHFAGLKAVGESVEQPLRYYRSNLGTTFSLLRAMQRHGIFRFVFSSSATVYGDPERVPIPESAPRSAANPYGRSKLMIEDICADVAASDDRWSMTMLRYFNPVGADASGEIGEDPRGTPNNLVPYVMQVAVGRRERVEVFGNDYATPDGTGVRDFIHVSDLARGHVAALQHAAPGWRAYNLGRGVGASVLDVIAGTSDIVGAQVPFEIVDRRPGDVASSIADPQRANAELGWRAERDLQEMLSDAWRWQSTHPSGFSPQ